MKQKKFSLASRDPKLASLIEKSDHKTLAIWAILCAKRVLPYFEKLYPRDHRPHIALATLQKWIDTGIFSMNGIRKASLDSHAAARDAVVDSPAQSAARACGQAVATAHVRTHAIGPAMYALQAIDRASNPEDVDAAIDTERNWQYQRLSQLLGNS